MEFNNESYALIIGINEVEDKKAPLEKLVNAINDAQAIQNLLETSCGFQHDNIIFLKDSEATRDKISELIHEEFSNKIGENDRFLLFYAGHADTRKSHRRGHETQGQLIPFDAQWRKGKAKWTSFYPINDLVREVIENIDARQILFLLDCCFSGITGKPGVFSYSGINKENMMEAASRQSVQIITASSKVEKILDSGQNPDHSMFTQAIIDVVKDSQAIEFPEQFLSASKLASKVTSKVLFESLGMRQRQSPQFYRIQPPDNNGEYIMKVFSESEYTSVENPFLFSEEDELLREAELLHIIHNDDTFRQIADKIQNLQNNKMISTSILFSTIREYLQQNEYVKNRLAELKEKKSLTDNKIQELINHLSMNIIIPKIRDGTFSSIYVPEFKVPISKSKERSAELEDITK